jgi:hypothetical protein
MTGGIWEINISKIIENIIISMYNFAIGFMSYVCNIYCISYMLYTLFNVRDYKIDQMKCL